MDEKNNANLYLVSTPIGNLDDITYRAVKTLQEVDLVVAEDTRRTKKLLTHLNISKKMISYHAHNEHHKTEHILNMIKNGQSIALVSDAGTPAIADPGFLLVREAIKHDIEPIIIPGVSSLTFAAVASGLPVDKFSFYGFLPPKKGKKEKVLEQIKQEAKTAFIFESPYKMPKTLACIASVCGPETELAIIREATKIHEEVIRGTVLDIQQQYKEKNWKGECVIAINIIEELNKPST